MALGPEPLVQVSSVHDHLAKEKSPTSVRTHNTQSPPPPHASCKADGRLSWLRRASSGWGPLCHGRHHLPADCDCGVMITCDCMGMLSSVLWLAI